MCAVFAWHLVRRALCGGPGSQGSFPAATGLTSSAERARFVGLRVCGCEFEFELAFERQPTRIRIPKRGRAVVVFLKAAAMRRVHLEY